MKAGDIVEVINDLYHNGQKYRIGQPGFVVETADFNSRIRIMIAGKTAWFFHFQLRKI